MCRFSLFILFLFSHSAVFALQEEHVTRSHSDVAGDTDGRQEERITRFHSDIAIDTDGRIEVAEHISVYAAGKEIKRGIVREIPLHRKNSKGKRIRMDYSVLTVKCNGENASYNVKHENGNLAIYIGDSDVLLDTGEYAYTIVYETYGHIGFFDGFDELYWNVTGTRWIFPIEKASAAITLPGNAQAFNTSCYTGIQGSTGKDCTVEHHGNLQLFTANTRLAPREGLTVAVAFPRGIITRPPPPPKAVAFWHEHKDTVCVLSGLLICIAYYFLSLRRAGKKSLKPVAIPTFKPPRGLSPASVRYLNRRKYDNMAFTATLVEMAVKGALIIRHIEKKKYELADKMNTKPLRPEERQMHTTVFTNSKTVEVSKKNRNKFANADTFLRNSLEKQWDIKDYFPETKSSIAISGIILNTVFVLYVLLTGLSEEAVLSLALASPFIALELLMLFTAGFDAPIGCQTFGTALTVVILSVGYALSGILDDTSDMEVRWLPTVFYAAMSVTYIAYARNLKVFTAEGAKLASELEGFKMYLKTAEEHRLNILTPPERTPELFEKLLPYAIALDVSNEWCKKFDAILQQFNYRPEWYDADLRTNGFATTLTTTFAALGSSFSSLASSAQSAPPSSSGSTQWKSGSSVGGYSGGGGGGGGGRGW
jgi:uncharacterized membrane protein YgcG